MLSIMRKIFIITLTSVLTCGCSTKSLQTYFPSEINQSRAKYYAVLQEQSIWKETSEHPQREVYRVMSLHPFSKPVLARLEKCDDSKIIATFKRGSEITRYGVGKLEISRTSPITKADFSVFTNLLQKAHFWELPSEMPVSPRSILDGSTEIIEGIKHGQYHFVNWSSPGPNYYFLAIIHLQRLGFPELLYPPLSMFYGEHEPQPLESELNMVVDNIKNFDSEKKYLDVLGSPDVEELDSVGKNIFYRVSKSGCLGIRFDKKGERLLAKIWTEDWFSAVTDDNLQPPSTSSQPQPQSSYSPKAGKPSPEKQSE